MDGTDANAFLDGNLDVAVVAPFAAPGVSNDPVLGRSRGTVAYHVHEVVGTGAAILGVQDSALVLLEDRGRASNCD